MTWRTSRLWVAWLVVAVLAAGCGNDDGGEQDAAGSGGCSGGDSFFSSDRQSAGTMPAPDPVGIAYSDGEDLGVMIVCSGGVVAALTISGDYQFSDWATTTCRGMWADGGFTPDDTATIEFSAAVHEEQRLRGVSSVTYRIPAYSGPGTYDVPLELVRMGSDLDQRIPEVTGSGTLTVEYADWGEAVLGTSSDLHLVGSFQGTVAGDVSLALDVPLFGCNDVD